MAAVTDGDTVILENGEKVRLIGMQAPKLPLGRPDFEPWPLGDKAKQTLSDLVDGAQVELRFGGAQRDRHDRILAHAFLADGTWVQQHMLEAGMARVYSFPDNRFCLDALYAAEQMARTALRGVWNDPYYAIRSADAPRELSAYENGYELVEGRVLLADRAGSRIYLNFGRYWKEDFTVTIDGAGRKLFEQSGMDPLSLEGALIRVRGWLGLTDGPHIEVTHPEQIEVLAAQ